jgi:hypothetical protein
MTDADLDQSYTALCHALADVGEDKALRCCCPCCACSLWPAVPRCSRCAAADRYAIAKEQARAG